MGRTRTVKDAPAQDAPAPDAPEQDAPMSLAALETQRGTIKKAARVFADVPGVPRVMLPDGRIATVQREQRTDETEGPSLIAILRPGQGDPNAGTRWSLADTKLVSDALAGAGVTLL